MVYRMVVYICDKIRLADHYRHLAKQFSMLVLPFVDQESADTEMACRKVGLPVTDFSKFSPRRERW